MLLLKQLVHINRVLISRFKVHSRLSILWSMTAFPKVSFGIFHVKWKFNSHVYLGITFGGVGFPFWRCTVCISILNIVRSPVIKVFLFIRKFCFVFVWLLLIIRALFRKGWSTISCSRRKLSHIFLSSSANNTGQGTQQVLSTCLLNECTIILQYCKLFKSHHVKCALTPGTSPKRN